MKQFKGDELLLIIILSTDVIDWSISFVISEAKVIVFPFAQNNEWGIFFLCV